MSTLQRWTVVASGRLPQGVCIPSILPGFLQNRLCLLHRQPVLFWIVVSTSQRICLWVNWSLPMHRFKLSTIDWHFFLFVAPSPYQCFYRWCKVRSNHKGVHSNLSVVVAYTHIWKFYSLQHSATSVLSEVAEISSLTFLVGPASFKQVELELHQDLRHEKHSS